MKMLCVYEGTGKYDVGCVGIVQNIEINNGYLGHKLIYAVEVAESTEEGVKFNTLDNV